MLEMLPKKRRDGDGLVLTRGSWEAIRTSASTMKLKGKMQFHNTTDGRFDLFVPECTASTRLLSTKTSTGQLLVTTMVTPKHDDPDFKPRTDGYWEAYIVPTHGQTSIEIAIEITGFGASKTEDEQLFASVDAAWLNVQYVVYGHHGSTTHEQKVVLPMKFPDPNVVAIDDEKSESENDSNDNANDQLKDSSKLDQPLFWRTVKPGLQVLCVPTHLLCHLDDPVNVVKRYVKRHARSGDFVCVGETPLAAMQGRVRHPKSVNPGFVAKTVCKLFNRFSSVATACGMQCLVDIVGRTRVVFAAICAVFARLVGIRGAFYKLAGRQANLIDDVSGQIPPYDQSITMGPVRVQETVDAVESKTNIPCAVVDVNDLSRVKGKFLVLGKSKGVDEDVARVALLGNPQGNAAEQTPLVIVRCDPNRRYEILQSAKIDEQERKRRERKGVKYKQK